VQKPPRAEILQFGQKGDLNAVRWRDWKANFAGVEGIIATGVRLATDWPPIVNLKADPYEHAPFESAMHMRWFADQMWLFVPIGGQVKAFLSSLAD
jgi:hypothetical protein